MENVDPLNWQRPADLSRCEATILRMSMIYDFTYIATVGVGVVVIVVVVVVVVEELEPVQRERRRERERISEKTTLT